jgi:hypothetical protein
MTPPSALLTTDRLVLLHTSVCATVLAIDVSQGRLPARAMVELCCMCLGYIVLFVVARKEAKALAAAHALAQRSGAKAPYFLGISDVKQSKDGFTEYKVEGSYKGDKWSAWRRFSEIRQLKLRAGAELAGLFPEKSSMAQWATGGDKGLGFVDERRRRLNAFLREVVKDQAAFEVLAEVPAARHAMGVPEQLKVSAGSGFKMEDALKEGLAALSMTIDLARHAASDKGGDGWKHHSTSSDGITCFLKQDGDFTYAMGRGCLDKDKVKVAEFLMSLEHRAKWDDLWKNTTELDTFQPYGSPPLPQTALPEFEVLTLGINHTAFSSPAKAFVGERDSVAVYFCARRKSDGAMLLALRSVVHPKAPEGMEGYIRAKIIVAGFLMEDRPDGKPGCVMTTMGLVDPNGAIPKFVISAVAPQRALAIRDINKVMLKLG